MLRPTSGAFLQVFGIRPVELAAELARLLYPSLGEIGELAPVGPGEMPVDYAVLLAHDDHMTVTVEAFHGTLVDVQPLVERTTDEYYARASVLSRRSDGVVVQFGLMKIALAGLADRVAEEIKAGKTPLGRVLLRHNVLRHVELRRLWRVTPGPQLRVHWDLEPGERVYGRSAGIWFDGAPAVDLLEIVHV